MTLELEMESILSVQAQERLHEAFGEQVETIFGDALTVLSIVAMEEKVTHRSLRYRVNMHATDLSGLLKTLCQKSFLVSTGRGSGTTYSLNETDSNARHETISMEILESLNQNLGTSSKNLESFDQNLETSSKNLETPGIAWVFSRKTWRVPRKAWRLLKKHPFPSQLL
ncbi:hypothetical protein [Hymenobacter volaticus]|uniref:Uncharacterized protein n=1 Tax=Hymenobacter volaticus TaxID=2932254 RepID=A0ABY4G4B2_9BACT|nr:hypothetical protein [Hymenobacter volaticus]UOQ65715.1 hypothetical protein MUN86_19630 [Hymenobacter volaticus]